MTELTYQDAFMKLKMLYHKTRVTPNVSIPSEIIEGILYGPDANEKPEYID